MSAHALPKAALGMPVESGPAQQHAVSHQPSSVHHPHSIVNLQARPHPHISMTTASREKLLLQWPGVEFSLMVSVPVIKASLTDRLHKQATFIELHIKPLRMLLSGQIRAGEPPRFSKSFPPGDMLAKYNLTLLSGLAIIGHAGCRMGAALSETTAAAAAGAGPEQRTHNGRRNATSLKSKVSAAKPLLDIGLTAPTINFGARPGVSACMVNCNALSVSFFESFTLIERCLRHSDVFATWPTAPQFENPPQPKIPWMHGSRSLVFNLQSSSVSVKPNSKMQLSYDLDEIMCALRRYKKTATKSSGAVVGNAKAPVATMKATAAATAGMQQQPLPSSTQPNPSLLQTNIHFNVAVGKHLIRIIGTNQRELEFPLPSSSVVFWSAANLTEAGQEAKRKAASAAAESHAVREAAAATARTAALQKKLR
jgi:hypothetical protein